MSVICVLNCEALAEISKVFWSAHYIHGYPSRKEEGFYIYYWVGGK